MLSLSDIVNVKVGIGRGVFEAPGATVIGGKKPSFNLEILKLFANGEQGFWYDPNDMGTMYQDAAGTVPVTAVGQPVGLIRDKSGRNNHAYQTTSASRPILRQNTTTGAYYLEFDGSDDFLQTSSVDFTATDKVSLFTGVRKQSTTLAMLYELSTSSSTTGQHNAFYLAVPETTDGTIFFRSRAENTGGSQIAKVNSTANPLQCVITCTSDIPNDINTVKLNGVKGYALGDLGVGNYGNYPLYIGRRGGTAYPFNGHIYGLIGIGKLTSDSETAAIEKELAKRTGVTLP